MPDLMQEIADCMTRDFDLKPNKSGKHLQQGRCPSCSKKSLWTFADTPWVVRCERANNCGYEAHAKELYPDLFNSWTDRYQVPEQDKPVEQRNPHAAAEAYLAQSRGFDLALITGTFTQEHYFDQRADNGRGAGTSTVRFALGESWWERLIDKPWRFGKKKANFAMGKSYAGHWWALPSLSFAGPDPTAPADTAKPPAELWLVEGIFDAIALAHHGIAAVALMSCNNYPEHALAELAAQLARQGGTVPAPKLVWALDGDKAGRSFTVKHAKRAREAGWECDAAQIPQQGKAKLDWNDAHQRDRLEEKHLKDYRYQGALLLADSAQDKALLIYHHTGRTDFELHHDNRLYWFSLDLERYGKAKDIIDKALESGDTSPEQAEKLIHDALLASKTLQPIANCLPQALYYQRHEVTGDAWYYFRVSFPHDGGDIKGTFTAGQLTTASEFKKQLLHMAAGAIYSGSSAQLERMMQRQLDNIKIVQTVDFIGYSASHKTYILGKVAVRGGEIHEANAEDYFDFDKLAIKTLQKSIALQVNTDREAYDRGWVEHLWNAFGAKGYIALAYWFGSLFAEQMRAEYQSFPFLEIVGEPGSGKTTLIQFLWKLFGRDYEGFDPSKSTTAGRLRTFTQVSNLPIVLIESDRETKTGSVAHVRSFDWDELKDALNTGARDNNICRLRWSWERPVPELGRSVFVIPAAEFKGKRPHVLILNDVAWKIVEACRSRHKDFVFVWRRERVKNFDQAPAMAYRPVATMNNTAFQLARSTVGLERMRVHDLRHTFGQRLRDAGVPAEDRALLMGHAIEGMPQHYATATIATLVDVANQVTKTRDRTTLLRVVNG